ncbi:MAG: T9SS type A sorting domain-containing protein [Calditrichaeota bacterium]|nr:T9SS type A sorting domain-containing protein [Calditrichota bacterium]
MKTKWVALALACSLFGMSAAPVGVQAKETTFEYEGDWSDESNWSNGLPEDGDDVIINADCYIDLWASVPSLGTLTINALLDNTSFDPKNFYIDYTLNINSGGEFRCDGDLTVYEQMWINAGGAGTFSGDVEVGDGDLNDLLCIEDDATFNGSVDVNGGDNGGLFFGSSDPPGGDFFTATFNGPVSVSGDMDVGDEYGVATVVFNNTLNVIGDITVYDNLTIKKHMECSSLDIQDYGTFHTYAGFSCWDLNVDGAFYSYADSVFVVESQLGMGGTFQVSKGTFKMNPTRVSLAKIIPYQNCYLNNLIISGNKPTELAQWAGLNEPLDINGDLTIESGKTFDVNQWTIQLAGNFNCSGTYEYDAGETPTFTFDGSGTQTLTGNVGFYHLNIASGSTVNTGSYTPTVAPSSLTESGYLVGQIACTQTISSDNAHSVGNLGCQISNGSDLGSVTVTRHTGSAHSEAKHSLTRWYNINAATADSSVTLRLEYRDSELNGNTESNLNIWRYSGGSWKKYEATSRDPSSNYVEATVEIPAGNSDWVLSDAQDDQSLPVSFVAAAAEYVKDGFVRLTWRVASEVNNRGFEVYRRSETESTFERIAFVEGRGTESTEYTYAFDDADVRSGVTYHYRLYSVSLGGERELLVEDLEVYAGMEGELPREFALLQNFPNPFNRGTQIRFRLPQACHVSLRIYNQTGRLVRTVVSGTLDVGEHRLVWDGLDDFGMPLPSGVYVARLTAGANREAKKMLLLR